MLAGPAEEGFGRDSFEWSVHNGEYVLLNANEQKVVPRGSEDKGPEPAGGQQGGRTCKSRGSPASGIIGAQRSLDSAGPI